MKKPPIKINWPNKILTEANEGDDWFNNAKKANISIPTGCLSGSCGACEIDVNGEIVRPCISRINSPKEYSLKVSFATDPFW